ncbi:MAG: ATP-dependent DNA helicase RecG [Solirubrobacteraceae bacterium]
MQDDYLPNPFAGSEPQARADLAGAPVRWPRASTAAEALEVRPARSAEGAAALGLHTVGDLIAHLPRDRREARTISGLGVDETATVVVEVRSITSRPVRRRGMKPLVEATVADASGLMKATFFNQPWLAKKYPPGTRLALHGKYSGRNAFRVSDHAITAEATGSEDGVAHYPATDGISSTQILSLVRDNRAAIAEALEPLPAALRRAEALPDLPAALEAAHFPGVPGDWPGARRRFAFDELFLLQLALLRRQARRLAASAAAALDRPRELTARWLAGGLPFALTPDQEAAVETIDRDLAGARPMQRLLMGEVGSGKTVVALFAMLRAVEHGAQAALMAPTETLAEQHFATLQKLMAQEAVPAALLTGSTSASRRRDTLGKLASGELGLIVGTHALIEDDVAFAHLALVVIDEQHRFGVRQRTALDRKAQGTAGEAGGLWTMPHVLHMTATPIPRTLRLTNFGELSVTELKTLPRGRRPVTTHVAGTEAERERAYDRLREDLRAGRQAFVVCPLVEESEALHARAATAEYERLRTTELKDFRVVLMHGQMRPAQKQEAMAAFAGGAADVLVATSVIEVGIDVPNASVLLVENAERYGLSQLHQLRGRVGRGQHGSVAILFGSKQSQRLKALVAHNDGFRLAEIDLELRQHGDLVGVRQSGQRTLRIAEMPGDYELLRAAHRIASDIVAEDPALERPEHALLADALTAAHGAEALEPIPA